jgi:hypothetical protein
MKLARVAKAMLATTALAVLAFGSTAQAAVPENATLEMSQPRLTFSTPLAPGAWYVVDASGTGSFVKPSMWTNPRSRFSLHPVICGTPESAPMFPTDGATGAVGFDPETQFARPTSRRRCQRDPLPRTTRRFQLDAGNGFRHPTTLTGRYSAPRADHAYSYPIQGGKSWRSRERYRSHGHWQWRWQTRWHKLDARVRDRPAWDNYGALQLTLRRADSGDCAGRQWHNFLNRWGGQVFDSVEECEAALV